MKVVMMTDIEGVAGVVTFEKDSYASGKYYEDAKRLLTAEVNAAVEGLLAAGVEDVLVLDMHGPGGICFEIPEHVASPVNQSGFRTHHVLEHVGGGLMGRLPVLLVPGNRG